MNPLQLAKLYIDRPSVSPDDQNIQALIYEQLKPYGFKRRDLSRGQTTNSIIFKGHGYPLVALAAHTDVVPAGNIQNWQTPPFEATLQDGNLIGRGAVDMKGALAAMVSALSQAEIQQGTVALFLTSDEEADATDGSVAICEWLQSHHITADCVLIGEPTSSKVFGDAIKHGRRGSTHANIIIQGHSAHVAYTDSSLNPIHQCAQLLSELNMHFSQIANTHFHTTKISADSATNVVPNQVTVRCNWRHTSALSDKIIEDIIQSYADKLQINCVVDISTSAHPYSSNPSKGVDVLKATIADKLGVNTTLNQAGGASDGRFFQHISPEVIEFGLINASIHQANEHTPVEHIEQLSAIYQSWLESMCQIENQSSTCDKHTTQTLEPLF